MMGAHGMMGPPPLPSTTTSKKRRFQAPITGYFTESPLPTESDASLSISQANYAAPTHSPSPCLSNKVQSSLLSVGMRVRKAVPEGYRTTEKTTRLDAGTYRTIHNPSDFSTGSQSSTSTTELAPLCGMFKVGNLAVQSVPRPASNNVSGSISIPALNPHKRSLELDQDSDDEKQPEAWAASNQTPGRTAFSPTNLNASQPTTLAFRSILTPKLAQKNKRISFRPKKGNGSRQSPSAWDQENRHNSPTPDFEDADFLRSKEEVDGELEVTEVEMGGV